MGHARDTERDPLKRFNSAKEMAEAANILRRSTRRSLLLIDEVGRGTGTLDGLAIAQAICEFLLDLQEQSPLVLFATHFHELCALRDHWNGFDKYIPREDRWPRQECRFGLMIKPGSRTPRLWSSTVPSL